MDYHELLRHIDRGTFPNVVFLVGPERFLAGRAATRLRSAVLAGGIPGFNDDVFHGGSTSAKTIVEAARTLPMMASKRVVLVHDIDRMPSSELAAFEGYVENPSPQSCVVVTAEKLDGRSRLAKLAKNSDGWVDVQPLRAHALRGFLAKEAERRGHALAPDAAAALLEAVGDDLATLDDGLERLSLYVGAKRPIDLAAIDACIERVRVDSIWTLVDAVSTRDLKRALGATASLLEDREPPLKILAMIARQLRMVAKMRQAVSEGHRGPDAAKIAGAPPFKAAELAEAARRFDMALLRRAFSTLRQADTDLKGSKRPPDVVLEEAVLRLCAAPSRSNAPASAARR